MIFISTRVHAIFDYCLGLFLVLAPWIMDFSDSLAAPMMLVGVGMFVFIVALMTDYELSAVHIIPMHMHRSLDVMLGLLLLMSPWLFSFENIAHGAHMICGAALIAVAACTIRNPAKALGTETSDESRMQWV